MVYPLTSGQIGYRFETFWMAGCWSKVVGSGSTTYFFIIRWLAFIIMVVLACIRLAGNSASPDSRPSPSPVLFLGKMVHRVVKHLTNCCTGIAISYLLGFTCRFISSDISGSGYGPATGWSPSLCQPRRFHHVLSVPSISIFGNCSLFLIFLSHRGPCSKLPPLYLRKNVFLFTASLPVGSSLKDLLHS